MFNNYLTLFQSKVPPLAFHSMTLCKDTIYIYGGITTNNKINGDLEFDFKISEDFATNLFENEMFNNYCTDNGINKAELFRIAITEYIENH